MPLVSLTPMASPTGCTATRTVMALSADTSWRSRWRSRSLTGSNCISRMTAMREPLSPSILSVRSCVVPSCPWMMRSTFLGSTAIGCGPAPPPYRMAGTTPSRRSRRAGPLPKVSRLVIVSSCIFIVSGSFYLDEQRGDGFLVVDPPYRFAEQRRHREHGDPRRAFFRRHRDGIGDHDLLEWRGLDPVHGGAGEDGVHAAGEDAAGALALEPAHRLHERARGVDHVVDDDGVLVLHVADEVHGHRRSRLVAPLVDDGEARVETLGDGARALHAARVRRHDHRVLEVLLAEVVDDDGGREEMVDGHAEEALDLARMQVEREHAIDARRLQEIGDELGRDRHPRLHLAVLARV